MLLVRGHKGRVKSIHRTTNRAPKNEKAYSQPVNMRCSIPSEKIGSDVRDCGNHATYMSHFRVTQDAKVDEGL